MHFTMEFFKDILFIELSKHVFSTFVFEVLGKLLLALDIACCIYFQIYAGNRLFFSQSRYKGNLARQQCDSAAEEASYDPEAVIRAFESQPSLHTDSFAFSEYVKALVKVDRLDESEFLKTFLRGDYLAIIAHFLLIVHVIVVCSV